MVYAKKSRLGRLKEKKNKEVKPFKGEDGRMKVNLIDKNGHENTEDLAILIARTFVPNPNNYEHVDFIDGNPENCRTDNLKWVE